MLVQPGATPVDGMENMHFLDIPTPIYGDKKDNIPPYVGLGPNGRPLGQNRKEKDINKKFLIYNRALS
jgi:hypothetical protein